VHSMHRLDIENKGKDEGLRRVFQYFTRFEVDGI